MIFLLLGGLALGVLMAALGAFSQAQVATIKQFGAWMATLGLLVLVVLLFLTGRVSGGIGALVIFGPIVWGWLRRADSALLRRAAPRPAPPRRGAMSCAEAYAVLGLAAGASEADIRAAHRRLMRAAHPDAGGSDWLAARINQARDLLLG